MTGRLATHRVDVYPTTHAEPTDSIAADPLHSGLTCHLMSRERGAAVLGRVGVSFDSLGESHYLLALGRYAERVTSGRVVQVTHTKDPVTRHWQPATETERYLVVGVESQAGAVRHIYAALRRV